MAKNLHVRINDENSRIWTRLPKGTKGAVELDEKQSHSLRIRVARLAKRNDGFKKHAAQLKAGRTVQAVNNGEIAKCILAVFPPAKAEKVA